MKSALVALDPVASRGTPFHRFCDALAFFQNNGFFSRTSVASVMHPSLYAMPYSFYKDMKGKLAKDVKAGLERECDGRFAFGSIRILQSESAMVESHVKRFSQHGQRMGSDILVLGSNNRGGLPHWFLGSFSETAALTAPLPVLVLKLSSQISELPPRASFVVGIDTDAPPSKGAVDWIAGLARETKAAVHLLHVSPRKRPLASAILRSKSKNGTSGKDVLKNLQSSFASKGVAASASTLEESMSVAHTIVGFAESKKAWLTIVTSPERSRARRLLLGSNARKILNLTKRPFLSLRTD